MTTPVVITVTVYGNFTNILSGHIVSERPTYAIRDRGIRVFFRCAIALTLTLRLLFFPIVPPRVMANPLALILHFVRLIAASLLLVGFYTLHCVTGYEVLIGNTEIGLRSQFCYEKPSVRIPPTVFWDPNIICMMGAYIEGLHRPPLL